MTIVPGFGCWHHHSMQRLLTFVMVGSVLLGCSERTEDLSTLYIIPANCTGHDPNGPPVCSQGDYPADTAFVVTYQVSLHASEVHAEECSIEQTGEFELTVHTSWLARNRDDSAGVAYLDCEDMTPPLSAGTWTIYHGTSSAALLIPSTAADTVCVIGQAGPETNCTEIYWEE
jgi:hypothetical protein